MYTIYGTESCRWCDRAKDLLDTVGEKHQYVDVGEDVEAQKMFKDRSLRTVPQVFLGDTYIGGYEALKKELGGV